MNDSIYKMTAISKDTLIPIGVTIAALIFVGAGAFSLSKQIEEYKYDIKENFLLQNKNYETLRSEIKSETNELENHKRKDWSMIDMERWTFLLEKSNRNSQVIVPSPGLVKGGEELK